MKHTILMAAGICVAMTSAAVAESSSATQKYSYTGDRTAARACRAVVRNDVSRLRRALLDIRNNSVSGYRYRITSPEIAGAVTCNGMGLDEFSQQVGSYHVAAFLATGSGPSLEMLASDAESPELAAAPGAGH